MSDNIREDLLLIVNTVLEKGGRQALDALPLDDDLRSDIGLDSFDLDELAVRIQAKFDVDVFEDSPVLSFRQILDKIS